jgi:hypothetical protein
VEGDRRRLMHLDGILPRGSNNLSTVELQPGDSVVILEGFEYSSAPKVPDLVRGTVNWGINHLGMRITRNDLSRLPVTT